MKAEDTFDLAKETDDMSSIELVVWASKLLRNTKDTNVLQQHVSILADLAESLGNYCEKTRTSKPLICKTAFEFEEKHYD